MSAVLLSTYVVAIGCNNSELPLVPIQGRVTFAGGPPPAQGTILFMPHSGSSPAGLPSKPGSARFAVDGSFEVTSFKEGDGLLPGIYGVSISCIKDYENLSPNPDAVSVRDYVPESYRADKLVVQEGQDSIELTYDIPAKEGR